MSPVYNSYSSSNHAHASGQGTELREPGPCAPAAICPACGGLECFCRPHFFPGQLLTDEALNRLERYVIGKNKLHNRYLHGWGVVCGLEAVCRSCGDGLLVRSGYALSPCGDDIVVADDTGVDICALIQACRPQALPDCNPNDVTSATGRAAGCREATERWVLAVCYDERPARGITPLKPANPSGSCSCGQGKSGRCGCGGAGSARKAAACGCGGRSGAGGCSCGAGAASPSVSSRARGGAACEPTLICEGYRFMAYRAPPRAPIGSDRPNGLFGAKAPKSGGPLVDRVICCIKDLIASLSALPDPVTKDSLHRWCCETKNALSSFLEEHGLYNCDLGARVAALTCPDPSLYDTDAAYQTALTPVIVEIAQLAAEYLRYCLCAALLPPCPAPIDGNCVPLATVTVRSSDCKVLEICNWGPRKHVLTFPTLSYYLSMLGLGDALKDAIERLCCVTAPRRTNPDRPLPGVAPAATNPSVSVTPTASVSFASTATASANRAAAPAAPPPTARGPVFTTLLAQAFRNEHRDIDGTSLFLDAFGMADSKGEPLVSAFERENAVPFLLTNQLLRPSLTETLPRGVTQLVAALVGGHSPAGAVAAARGTAAPAVTESTDVRALQKMLSELQATVKSQGEQLEKLRARTDRTDR